MYIYTAWYIFLMQYRCLLFKMPAIEYCIYLNLSNIDFWFQDIIWILYLLPDLPNLVLTNYYSMEKTDDANLLTLKYGEAVLAYTPYPKPWNPGVEKVKAIYLGCDPSNRSQDRFEYAFALEGTNPRYRAFLKSHENNLAAVNLGWDKVYVQNLCQNYFREETSKNLKLWRQVAREFWIPRLKEELSIFGQNIPVLLTSQYLLEVLAFDGYEKIPAFDFYNCDQPIPVPASKNHLERPLIPFYRGRNPRLRESYHLSNDRWGRYRERIKEAL